MTSNLSSALPDLEIEFATGVVYRYFDVPLDVYQDLVVTRIRNTFASQRVEVSAQ